MSGVGGVFKGFVLGFLIFLFFVLMSGLDFVVHGVLYRYGLQFSFDWAVFYWNVYTSVFIVFAAVVGFVYWLGSGRSRRDLKVSLCLFLSVCLLFLGGLADVLWFVLWAGGLPSNDVVWWWMPWFMVFGIAFCSWLCCLEFLWSLLCFGFLFQKYEKTAL